MPLQRHSSPFSGNFFHLYHLISLSFFFELLFSSCFGILWIFLISLCRLFHIFSSVLLFVSSEQEFAKDLVLFFDSGSVQGPTFYSPLFPPRAVQYEVFECFSLLTTFHTRFPASLPRVFSQI